MTIAWPLAYFYSVEKSGISGAKPHPCLSSAIGFFFSKNPLMAYASLGKVVERCLIFHRIKIKP